MYMKYIEAILSFSGSDGESSANIEMMGCCLLVFFLLLLSVWHQQYAMLAHGNKTHSRIYFV